MKKKKQAERSSGRNVDVVWLQPAPSLPNEVPNSDDQLISKLCSSLKQSIESGVLEYREI